MSRRFRFANVLAAALFFVACVTPVAVSGDVDVDVDGPPPDVLATVTPVYYDGVPAYWWGGHWYYRNGGAWRFYRSEPGYLHDYRARVGVGVGGGYAHAGPARVYPTRAYYGRPRAAVSRGGRR